MKKVRNSVVCAVLCLTMMMGSAFSSMAASGTVYSYANLRLDWHTSKTSASATVVSDKYAHLTVYVHGNAYSGSKKMGSFEKSNVKDGYSVSCSASRKSTTSIKNGIAEGTRNWSAQYLYTNIYY